MRNRTLAFIFIFSFLFFLTGCVLQCITGGNLHVRKKYVSNICGLANGVYVAKIKVDSFENDIPIKYTRLKSATLYRAYNTDRQPHKLYFKSDCKQVYGWNNEVVADTIKGPWTFEHNACYLVSSSDANTDIFIFIDSAGKKRFKETDRKSWLKNF